MAGVGQGHQLLDVGGPAGRRGPDLDEDAVVAVGPRGGPTGSPATGRMPLPSLPVLSAMICSIQRPRAARGSGVISVTLSRPSLASAPRSRPRVAPGFPGGSASVGLALLDGDLGMIQDLGDVQAHQGGGDHAEVGQGGVSAADVAGVEEDLAEAVALGVGLHLGAGVGDGHEVLARLVALGLLHLVEEVGVEDRRLGGRAALAGDDEQGLGRVDLPFDPADRGRDGAIEDEQGRVAGDGRAGRPCGGPRRRGSTRPSP